MRYKMRSCLDSNHSVNINYIVNWFNIGHKPTSILFTGPSKLSMLIVCHSGFCIFILYSVVFVVYCPTSGVLQGEFCCDYRWLMHRWTTYEMFQWAFWCRKTILWVPLKNPSFRISSSNNKPYYIYTPRYVVNAVVRGIRVFLDLDLSSTCTLFSATSHIAI